MKKKPHLSSRQPPTDDQILRRMKRDSVPAPRRRMYVAYGPGDCVRTSVEPAPSYPKGCLPQIDAQMAQDKIVGDAWDYYMKSCAALGLDVMTLLRRVPKSDIIELASEVVRRAGLARDAYEAYLGRIGWRLPYAKATPTKRKKSRTP
jgi:hypothetical protein